MACLLEHEPASQFLWPAEGSYTRRRSESESEEGAQSQGLDTKPGELTMTRVKVR